MGGLLKKVAEFFRWFLRATHEGTNNIYVHGFLLVVFITIITADETNGN